METRNIFLDSSIFIGQNYNYKSTIFDHLRRLTIADKAKVYVTDIVVRELKAHIASEVLASAQAFLKFKKEARVLKTIDAAPYCALFQEFDTEDAIQKLGAQLTSFLAEIDATILSTSNVSVDQVFDRYFAKQPPFGESRKKSEFPDAFTARALEIWCEENNDKVYIVSTDLDLKNYCDQSEHLISLGKLAEFIDLVEYHDEILAPTVGKLLAKTDEDLKKAISESFSKANFSIKNAEGTVDRISVDSVSITKMFILEIGEHSAVINVDANIMFTADITYIDPYAPYYYYSDEEFSYSYATHKTIQQSKDCNSTITIKHNGIKSEEFFVETADVEPEALSDFWIYVDD